MTNNNPPPPRIICDLSSPESSEPSYSYSSSIRSRTSSIVSATSSSSPSSIPSLPLSPNFPPSPIHNQRHQNRQYQQDQELETSQQQYTYTYTPPRSHPAFPKVIRHLSTRLSPLISVSTGLPHPDFPQSLLSYHLLTSTQLDSLARHFHQVHPPLPQTGNYPTPIPPWIGTKHERDTDVATKRRRFGRFIGLQGCGSPEPPSAEEREGFEEEERRIRARLDQEWEEEMRKIREEEEGEWKTGGRWYFL